MLLVILGAGASFDSVPLSVLGKLQKHRANLEFRPPLLSELLPSRRPFGEALSHFPQCAGLITDLRRRLEADPDIGLEALLEEKQAEAATYPPAAQELMAFRYYLQEILSVCGDEWWRLSRSETNYSDLLRRIDRWRHAQQTRVAIVTFNYDTLLDRAAESQLGMHLGRISEYVAGDAWQIFKPHGSVNWGRWADWEERHSNGDQIRRYVIENSTDLKESDEFVVADRSEPQSGFKRRKILVPALAIPLAVKDSFQCPQSHVREMEKAIRRSFKILVIGWRATEAHFLQLLDGLPGKAPQIEVVTESDASSSQTLANLHDGADLATDISDGQVSIHGQGFSKYLQQHHLESFLDR